MEHSLDLAAYRHRDLVRAAEQHRTVTAARAELRAVRLARRAAQLHERAARLASHAPHRTSPRTAGA